MSALTAMRYVSKLRPFMPWHHNLSPYALGPFGPHGIGIRWYGLAYLFGFALAWRALRRAAMSGKVAGLKIENIENLVFGIVVGVLGGGRLGYCVQYMDHWRQDPLFLFKISEGGMAFFGGITGVILVLLYYRFKHHLDLFQLGDVLAPVAAFSLGIGRLANFVNGELYGKPTGSDWGVILPANPSAARHPSQLYDFASHMLLFVILVVVARTPWGRARGTLGCLFMVLYGLFRVFTEMYREQDYYVGPFSGGQIASLILSVVGVGFFVIATWLNRQPKSTPAADV